MSIDNFNCLRPMFFFILFIGNLISRLTYLGGQPRTVVQTERYSKIQLTDECYWETLRYGSDSVLVIQTVCSPVCSSVANLYTADGKLIHPIKSPSNYVFPFASIEDGRVTWSDHLSELLDDTEKLYHRHNL